jgi:hypothetical protein
LAKTKKNIEGMDSSRALKVIIGFVTILLITMMFPKYDTIDADYVVGMVWSKEDLIAPFSFPVYKSDAVYQREVDEAKSRVYPVFRINPDKSAGQNWLDSLNIQISVIQKILAYRSIYEKEKSLPEEKQTVSEKALDDLKAALPFTLTEAELSSMESSLNTANFS